MLVCGSLSRECAGGPGRIAGRVSNPEPCSARAWWYHCQASGLMGSPTVPRMRRLSREYLAGQSSPKACSARIAVGAVYRILTCARQIRNHQ